MAAGQWELRISEVLVKFGVTKEKCHRKGLCDCA